ncbi:hypothetical protein [Fibrobacter sp.]|uniref:hypothetical protein n=1 Tax=Fibrobacter sp. TaxID=35828 RepID=UPI003868492B
MPNEIDAIIKSFTPEQQKLYDSMMADEKKLLADWIGSRNMYNEAMKVINDKEIGPRVRLYLKGISSYWSGRKKLMETLLISMGKEELLNKWIADVQKSK